MRLSVYFVLEKPRVILTPLTCYPTGMCPPRTASKHCPLVPEQAGSAGDRDAATQRPLRGPDAVRKG